MQARTPTIHKHIFGRILRPTLCVMAGLLSLIWLMQSLRFLDLMINKGLTLGTFLHLTSLMIPSLLVLILPLGVLAGAIYTFKNMNDNNELSALFSAGLARGQIIQPALWAAVVMMIASYSNALFFMPWTKSTFKKLQHEIRHSEGHLLLEEGTFNPLGDNVMVYLKNRVGRTGLNMLLVHDNRDQETPVTWMAKHGNISFSPEGRPSLTLIEGIRQEVTPTQTSMLAFKEHTLDIQRQISKPKSRVKGPEERFLHELSGLEGETLHGKNKLKYGAEKMRRILWPLTPVVLMMLTAAILIQPRSGRRGVMRPVIASSVAGLTYIMLLIATSSMAEGGTSFMMYGQALLPLSFIILSLFFLIGRKSS